MSSIKELFITEPRIYHAYNTIFEEFGDRVVIKPRTLYKFGRNEGVGTASFATVQTLPGSELNETYVSTNAIDQIVSSSASDSEEIFIEGHTIDGNGDFTFVTQVATLNGQTKVALSTPLARCTRLFNNNSNNLVGNVYVFQDGTVTSGVPDTDSGIHCIIPAGKNQSFKASTTASKEDYFLITQLGGGVDQKSSAAVDFLLQVRRKEKVFREILEFTVNSAGGTYSSITLNPPIIVPKNSDVRMTAIASANSTAVTAFMNGYLAKIEP